MDGDYDPVPDFDELLETISRTEETRLKHDHSNLVTLFSDIDMLTISPLNINDIDFQNQTTEEIDANNTMDDDVTRRSNDSLFNKNVQQKDNSDIHNLLDQPTTSAEHFPSSMTNHFYDEGHFQMHYSIKKYDRDHEMRQSNRLDDAWENLRAKENELVKRNVPRFLMVYTDREILSINCTLRMLLNAPVFIRIMLKFKKISQRITASLPSIRNTDGLKNNIQGQRDVFSALLKIIQITFEEHGDEEGDHRIVQSFRKEYEPLYSPNDDWVQQDPVEICIHLLNILCTVANNVNEQGSYSKAFEIPSSVSIDYDEPRVEKERIIDISSNVDNFLQHINEQYSGTKVNYDGEHTIKREYELLPEQILVANIRVQNGNDVTYPNEFQTCHNQCYLLTGAVILNNTSSNADHYITVLRRQDCVYLFNSDRLIDRFNIDYLATFFKSVHVRVLVYTEVDAHCEHICTFEDPLARIDAGKPHYTSLGHDATEQVAATTIEFDTVIPPFDALSVIIRHSILSTWRHYMHTDFSRDNIRTALAVLKDCLEQSQLHFSPRSMFAGSFAEFSLIFKAPDDQYYRSHYELVRFQSSGPTFENPIYFEIEEDDDEWFTLTFTVSKSKQETFQPEDEDTCQIIRYPDGKIEKIDEEKLLSFTKLGGTKKNSRRKLNNNSGKVTPFRLSKVVDVNTLYLAIRRARYLPEQKKYVADSDVVFLSNAFRPVSSSIKKCEYDYSSDKLQILSALQLTQSPENDNRTVHLSYSIPEAYKCTRLRDKSIQVTILTDNDGESRVHPIYQILDNQVGVSSTVVRATAYSSPLSISIVKRTIEEFENDSELCKTLTDSFTDDRKLFCLTRDNLQSIFTSPGMNSFRIQLELGHQSNDGLIIYPKSAVQSEKIVDGNSFQQEQPLPQSSEINIVEPNDTLIDQPSAHVKRPSGQETNASFDLPSIKHLKLV